MPTPYRATMYAIMKDGKAFMILPDLDTAETHLGLWSHNGFSKHRWTLLKVEVKFSHESAAERRKRTGRSVQAVIELNQQLSGHG